MDKQFYIDKYHEFYDECLIKAGEENPVDVTAGADTIFEETASAEHIVGYYLHLYDEPLKEWTANLAYAIDRWGKETELDKEVSKILKGLFEEKTEEISIADIEEYIQGLNLNDYDLGGVEITEFDYVTIAERVNKSKQPLEKAVDEYLFEIREVLDDGLFEEEKPYLDDILSAVNKEDDNKVFPGDLVKYNNEIWVIDALKKDGECFILPLEYQDVDKYNDLVKSGNLDKTGKHLKLEDVKVIKNINDINLSSKQTKKEPKIKEVPTVER